MKGVRNVVRTGGTRGKESRRKEEEGAHSSWGVEKERKED